MCPHPVLYEVRFCRAHMRLTSQHTSAYVSIRQHTSAYVTCPPSAECEDCMSGLWALASRRSCSSITPAQNHHHNPSTTPVLSSSEKNKLQLWRTPGEPKEKVRLSPTCFKIFSPMLSCLWMQPKLKTRAFLSPQKKKRPLATLLGCQTANLWSF